jgi:hypothetical protein
MTSRFDVRPAAVTVYIIHTSRLIGRLSPIVNIVHDRPPSGLGSTYARIEKLIRDDVEALSLWTAATRRLPSEGQTRDERGRLGPVVDNIHDRMPERPSGTSREAALRRLNKAAAEGNEEAVKARRSVLAGEQRRFVLWRDAQEKHHWTRNLASENDDARAALCDFDLDRDEVHRWRKQLKDPRKFDADLLPAQISKPMTVTSTVHAVRTAAASVSNVRVSTNPSGPWKSSGSCPAVCIVSLRPRHSKRPSRCGVQAASDNVHPGT